MKLKTLIFLLSIALIFQSCRPSASHSNRVIIIQPFGDVSSALTSSVYQNLKGVNPNTFLKKATALPKMAYYQPRNRYWADSLIKYLNRFASADIVYIGLTGKDISTTEGNIADWGIMGLGFEPGNACVVSSFRLSKSNLTSQFYKVALHELGHTQDLPHCPNKTCLMRDAEGGNHLDEETSFCPKCMAYLQNKGWHLK